MNKYIVEHTSDKGVTFQKDIVEADNLATAYVDFMIKAKNDEECEITNIYKQI